MILIPRISTTHTVSITVYLTVPHPCAGSSRAPLPRVKQGPTPYYSKCCDVEQREGELKSPWLYKFSDFTLRAAAQFDI